MPPRRSSLRFELVLTHLTVIVLAMGLSGALLLSSLERYFLEAAEQSLLAQARITAQALIPGALTIGPPAEEAVTQAPSSNFMQQQQAGNLLLDTQNLILPETAPAADLDLSYLTATSVRLGAQLDTRIRILDASGVVLVDSHGVLTGGLLPADLSADPLAADALAGSYGVCLDCARETAREPRVLSVALPTTLAGEVVGVVYLEQPLTDILLILADLRRRWLISTAIALAVSGGVGLLLARAITRPVLRLTTAAESIARGDFAVSVPVTSLDELGRLSRTFNEMTARLRAARQMQTDFVANVSHELRTPLTAIKGMVETLRDGAVEDVAVRDRFLGTVEHETNRLIRLVNDLLTLSRADSAALNLRREPVDARALLQAAVDRLTPLADVHEIALTTTLPADLPRVHADPDRVAQILGNLLDNAIKYSRPGGEVNVRAWPEPDGPVWIEVEDHGLGIPAEALPRLGERFYRTDKARARAQGGSGLGLAIAQALIEAHGGRLWLASEEDGGTVASFTLPREP